MQNLAILGLLWRLMLMTNYREMTVEELKAKLRGMLREQRLRELRELVSREWRVA